MKLLKIFKKFHKLKASDLLNGAAIFPFIGVGFSRQSEWHSGIGNNKRLILGYGSSKQTQVPSFSLG